MSEPEPSGRPQRATIDGERLIAVFSHLIEPLGRSLPANSEVVLHDLSLLPNSVVAVHGTVTGRLPGDPATDMLLKAAASGDIQTMVGYETQLRDGRQLKSSTLVIHDVAGNAVAALCINTDVSAWHAIHALAAQMIGAEVSPPPTASVPETFVKDIEELAELLISEAIREIGVPVELMHKKHKLRVVRSLESRGFFLIRDGVEMIASALHVTRFTIYNYLKIPGEADDADS